MAAPDRPEDEFLNSRSMRHFHKRSQQSSLAKRIRKIDCTPLPQHVRDVLSLDYHLQLEALKAGVGSMMSLQILTRVALAAGMLRSLGYGASELRTYREYEAAAWDALVAGRDGEIRFDDHAYRLFAGLVTLHDDQLARAPVSAIESIANRLESPCQGGEAI
ncbi:Fis family transcriptional regulator [Burkholderia stagnalis]|uniref:Fis family transcriptional regulator n=1 Tax=Burkholderia stagnalis TaxID=1503054 RepID=UPI001E575B8B|nr:Fis family transcriptional regulator [Burkholderia stagnalis]